MKLTSILAFSLLVAVSPYSMAQWQWIDGQGRKVFSDRPPPADIPANNVLRQPSGSSGSSGGSAGSRSPAPSTASAATNTTPAAATSGTDDRLAQRQRATQQQEGKQAAQDTAKAQADKARLTQARNDNCERARSARDTLTSGRMLGYTNAQGERGFMDEDTRAAEIQRAESVMNSDCGPVK
jgi:cytoskeletal protein RodZ